jgi:dimethylargininase
MIALLREVSPRLADCELTHVARTPLDPTRAALQHDGYAATLRGLGASVEYLPALPHAADGVFVEDLAVVLPEVAILARPGVASRQIETESMADTLGRFCKPERLADSCTLEGGDVLLIGRTLYVGTSTRTNLAGLASLREIVAPFGYDVQAVPVHGCLHLKTACTFVPPHFIVINPDWIDAGIFRDFVNIATAKDETFAANTLTLNRTTLCSASFPRTEKSLRHAGIRTQAVDISELHKAEAGLTCLSVLF